VRAKVEGVHAFSSATTGPYIATIARLRLIIVATKTHPIKSSHSMRVRLSESPKSFWMRVLSRLNI
jgi:hypothetical protein